MKIANCKCGSVPERDADYWRNKKTYWYACLEKYTCGIAGPARKTPEQALAAWNELMNQPAEPAAGSVQIIWVVRTDPKGIITQRMCCDEEDVARLIETASGIRTENGSCLVSVVRAYVPLAPQPAEIKGSVE